MSWILGKATQHEIDTSSRSFRRRITWCWNIEPPRVTTGEIHRQIMLDGTYFNGWCVLVAYTGTHVIDWQWCDKESLASWTALLERLTPPDIAVVDGNAAALSAITSLWPHTRVQRCLFHLRQGAHRHLTRRPNLEPSKELLSLFKALSHINDLDQAAIWMAQYASWETRWNTFLKHRTYPRPSTPRPASISATQSWWYTHIALRRARQLLAQVVRQGHLFTWLEHARPGEHLARTTSPLEGAINAGIKDLLRTHRGLSPSHARRAIDWFLYTHTHNPTPPMHLVKPEHWQPQPRAHTTINTPLGPALYDTAFTPDEGITLRKGWAGRSH